MAAGSVGISWLGGIWLAMVAFPEWVTLHVLDLGLYDAKIVGCRSLCEMLGGVSFMFIGLL